MAIYHKKLYEWNIFFFAKIPAPLVPPTPASEWKQGPQCWQMYESCGCGGSCQRYREEDEETNSRLSPEGGNFSREVARVSLPSQKKHNAQAEWTPLNPECPLPLLPACISTAH